MNYTYKEGQSLNTFHRRVYFRKLFHFIRKVIVGLHHLYIVLILLIFLSLIISEAGLSQEKKGDTKESTSAKKISLDVKSMNIVDVLKILADEGGFNISISEKVTGRVTLFLEDIDVWDALNIVLISGGLAYEKKGDIIYVMREDEYELRYGRKYWDQRKIKVFNLKYTSASKIKRMLSQLTSEIGKVIADEATDTLVIIDTSEKIAQMSEVVKKIDRPLETKTFELNYLSAKDAEKKLSEVLTKEVGRLEIDEATNKIIITDYPKKLKEIEEMIKAFDEKPLQVLIDAKIVEVKPSKKFYSGINWNYWIRKYFKTTGTFSIPTTSTDKISFGAIGTGSVAEIGQYTGILEFLQTFGEINVLSTPRILVLNNQEAKILVGTKDVYITSSVSQTSGTAVTTQEVNYVDVGVKLYVTPTINRTGYITLKIRPEISSSVRETLKTEDKETQVPIVTTSEAETTVIVKDGVSIIIGGLRKVTREKERKQVPLLGNIPVLGTFFSSKKDEWSKNELVIVLTPQIVSGDKSIEMELKEKIEKNEEKEKIKEEEDRGDLKEDIVSSEEELSFEREKEETKEEQEEAQKEEKEEMKEGKGAEQKKERQLGKISEDREYSYYLRIIEKIKDTLSLSLSKKIVSQSKGTIKGEGKREGVKVRLVISREGRLLEEPKVIFSPTEHLGEVAKDIIKKSLPFPPFPEFKKQDREIFEILLPISDN